MAATLIIASRYYSTHYRCPKGLRKSMMFRSVQKKIHAFAFWLMMEYIDQISVTTDLLLSPMESSDSVGDVVLVIRVVASLFDCNRAVDRAEGRR